MTVRTLDELAGFWAPALLRRPGLTPWERGFVASFVAKARNPRWRPSAKQCRVLCDLIDRRTDDDAPDLIDVED